jgi:hypothetical protein
MTVVAMDVSAESAEGLEEELVRQLVDRAQAEKVELNAVLTRTRPVSESSPVHR